GPRRRCSTRSCRSTGHACSSEPKNKEAAYWLTVLEPLGLRVHFIDNWLYHELMGEVHCGTSTMRRPMEITGDTVERWWDHHDPEQELRYDPYRVPIYECS